MDKMRADMVPESLLDNQAGDEDDILLWDDVEQEDMDLSAEERIFLQEFPIIKRELEEAIRKNHALADETDRAQETFTKANVVTGSVAVTSSVMTILGLALAPVTVGGSLMLSAAGTGLGTAAGAASIVTSFLERHHNKRVQAQVSSQVPTCDQEIIQAVDIGLCAHHVIKCGENINDMKKKIDALRIAKAHPRLASSAKRLLTSGEVSTRSVRRVQKAFQGTPLVMKTSTRFLSGALAGVFLTMELHSLLNDCKQLKEGRKTESAEMLRAEALKQEQKLTELTQLYEFLKKKEERLRDSFSEEDTRTLPQPSTRHGEAGSQVAAIAG